jgi:hypothetical protein
MSEGWGAQTHLVSVRQAYLPGSAQSPPKGIVRRTGSIVRTRTRIGANRPIPMKLSVRGSLGPFFASGPTIFFFKTLFAKQFGFLIYVNAFILCFSIRTAFAYFNILQVLKSIGRLASGPIPLFGSTAIIRGLSRRSNTTWESRAKFLPTARVVVLSSIPLLRHHAAAKQRN